MTPWTLDLGNWTLTGGTGEGVSVTQDADTTGPATYSPPPSSTTAPSGPSTGTLLALAALAAALVWGAK